MGGYAIRRVLLFIPTVVVLTMIVYFVMWIIPGDPALFILTGGGEDDGGTGVREEDLQLLRHELGIDRPIYIRYADWMWHLIRGDFGESIWYKIPVMDELKNRFPVSIQLAVMATVISVVLGRAPGCVVRGKTGHAHRLYGPVVHHLWRSPSHLLDWDFNRVCPGILV